MVNKIKIGVIGIQGAISEHILIMQKTLEKEKTPGDVFIIKNKEEINNVDALILPGGETVSYTHLTLPTN